MKINWFLTLCVSLGLGAGMDLGPFIRIGQCRSMCLQSFTTDGKCSDDAMNTNIDFVQCWNSCEFLDGKEEINELCENCNPQDCQITACFYQARTEEESEYKPTKLPAPEEDDIIHMNKNDIALLMLKTVQGRWKKDQYYCANEQLTTKPDNWIIVINKNGAIKHYSWDKWQPRLQSLNLPQDGSPLYQANITWENGHKKQYNQEQNETFFVVTWQQETGDGIMGNQVVNSKSAQISLPPGSRYLVRIATDNGPGSYPIIVDTKLDFMSVFHKLCLLSLLLILMFSFMCFLKLKVGVKDKVAKAVEKYAKPIAKNVYEIRMEEGRIRDVSDKTERSSSSLGSSYSDFSISTSLYNQMLQMRIDINANVETQDANADTQNTNANAQNTNVTQ